MNDFQTDLEYSLEERENEIFDRFYFRVFPNLKTVELVSEIRLQLDGIDKRLIFNNGKAVLVDEKKRRKDYGDILLEEYSDFERKKIGWLGRHKKTDYIVYAVMPSQKVYLLPFLLLQKAWIRNYKYWTSIYERKFAENEGYRTSNIPIPVNVLLDAILKEMKETLTA